MAEAVHAGRLARARAALTERTGEDAAEALLVTDAVSLRYLVGYTGSNAALVLTPDGGRLLTDFRYAEAVSALAAVVEVEVADRDLTGVIGPRLGELAGGAGRIGFEAGTMPWSRWRALADDAPAGVELVPVTGLLEALRAVKSPSEVAAIRAASALLEPVYRGLVADGLVGRTEREVVWWIERTLREGGGEGIAFPPIVAAGPHGARPHAEPRDVAIERGTLVVCDFGATVEGYRSDCTRTLVAGGPPDAAAAEDYGLVLEAQLAGLAAVRPGAHGIDVDEAARGVLRDAGRAELFGHGLGHGVGLEIHEAPTLRATSTDVLAPGMVVSVEPGVYRPGAWGIRIEDLVVVTEAGCEVLTGFTKALTETA